MEAYYRFKFYVDFVIPIILLIVLAILAAVILVILLVDGIRSARKKRWEERFFTEHGYRRELLDVPSVGSGEFWGWVREESNVWQCADDRDLRRMTREEIEKVYS